MFTYDPAIIEPSTICKALEDIGFQARIPNASATNNTSDSRSGLPGVKSNASDIKSIKSKVSHNNSKINGGLRQDLLLVGDERDRDKSQNQAEGIIEVEGMTCQSCVKTIEGQFLWILLSILDLIIISFNSGMISEKTGVCSIKVSLEQKIATVIFNEKFISANEISESINDMGFEASIKLINGRPFSSLKKGLVVVDLKQ